MLHSTFTVYCLCADKYRIIIVPINQPTSAILPMINLKSVQIAYSKSLFRNFGTHIRMY